MDLFGNPFEMRLEGFYCTPYSPYLPYIIIEDSRRNIGKIEQDLNEWGVHLILFCKIFGKAKRSGRSRNVVSILSSMTQSQRMRSALF